MLRVTAVTIAVPADRSAENLATLYGNRWVANRSPIIDVAGELRVEQTFFAISVSLTVGKFEQFLALKSVDLVWMDIHAPPIQMNFIHLLDT